MWKKYSLHSTKLPLTLSIGAKHQIMEDRTDKARYGIPQIQGWYEHSLLYEASAEYGDYDVLKWPQKRSFK